MEALTEILSYAFWVLLAITILVFVHEMGHFLFAKLFNMRVDRFSVGFPPKIFGKKIGETEYVIGATPLGGYVKIAGMVDESMDTDFTGSEPEPWEFRSKPVWQRIVVITAGVIFNVLLACIIFIGLKYVYGESYIPAENVRSVYVAEGSLAYEMGLRTGDRIVEVSGNEPERFSDLLDVQALLALPRESQALAIPAQALEAPRAYSVLVADDSLSVRKSLTTMLSDWGYEVRPARDGMEAVQLMDESLPDILLVDLEMPRMNGLELTAHLRDQEHTRDLPVIMVTSRAMEKHRRRATEVGVDVYLTKPYRDTDLLREIEQQLQRSRVA